MTMYLIINIRNESSWISD